MGLLPSVLAALDDAGITPEEVDGFASFSNDANEAALMQVALGVPEAIGVIRDARGKPRIES